MHVRLQPHVLEAATPCTRLLSGAQAGVLPSPFVPSDQPIVVDLGFSREYFDRRCGDCL